MKKLLLGSLLATAAFASNATVVEMQTSQGTIKIDLFDQQTPKTVANFLTYVESEAYHQTVIHRSLENFIIQGGGFTFTDDFKAIETSPAVANEPVLSNVKGTVAMAKVGGNPNSATSQWFFNLKDNSANLDKQNGGFTVFGQITADSYAVLDKISALVHCGEIPVVNITKEQCASADTTLAITNLVSVNSVVVLDDDPNSSANLSPKENTLINDPTQPDADDNSSGSMSWLLPLLLLGFNRRRAA
ncbi:hypothetical protein LCGC14_1529450 [marine sediment metagenome]|uniref:Peptidyl-prolyl cis-trans isomerase n=2 Tax=root TaxID=1 RepID=A0A7V1GE47_9GAMM|nr:peptidylprolyl isomerase [Pseudoalteromonas prydzensis]HEA15877.1 peptidylprolyl isomerase [Pseudoalteromonas prydzensis]